MNYNTLLILSILYLLMFNYTTEDGGFQVIKNIHTDNLFPLPSIATTKYFQDRGTVEQLQRGR